jgi:hypothetical protein
MSATIIEQSGVKVAVSDAGSIYVTLGADFRPIYWGGFLPLNLLTRERVAGLLLEQLLAKREELRVVFKQYQKRK